MDIRELLVRIRAGQSGRAIQEETGVDRRTVKKYRQWAVGQGLLEGNLPPVDELQARIDSTMESKRPSQTVSSVESYRALVVQLRAV